MIGTVIYYVNHHDRPGGFGFLSDDRDPDNRSANIWFGPKALNGLVVRAGDRVKFELLDFKKPGRGPQAARVWLDDDDEEITTLEGMDNVA